MGLISRPVHVAAKALASLRTGSRVRRTMLGLGVLSFIGGIVLLMAGAYSAFDVDSAAEPPQAVVAAPTVVPTPTPSPSVTSAPTVTLVPGPPLGDATYRFVFEKLGVDAPVETYGLDENAVPIVPTGETAADVVAWYDFSAEPGTGNAVFAGHVTWYGQAVFYDLKTSAPGDVIKLRGDDGTELAYIVTWVDSLDPSDPESVKVMFPTDPPSDVITIITCDGAFQDTNDPVFGGEYSRRLIVRAERVA